MNYEYNSSKALKYLQESKHLTISKTIILKVYKELRYVIYRYLYIRYQTEPLGESIKINIFPLMKVYFRIETENKFGYWELSTILV